MKQNKPLTLEEILSLENGTQVFWEFWELRHSWTLVPMWIAIRPNEIMLDDGFGYLNIDPVKDYGFRQRCWLEHPTMAERYLNAWDEPNCEGCINRGKTFFSRCDKCKRHDDPRMDLYKSKEK